VPGYFQYFSFGLDGYIDRLLTRVRDQVVRIFLTTFQPTAAHTVLDIGASADEHPASNLLEKRYPYPSRICALALDHLPALHQQFPRIRLVRGDARALPFAAESFDLVYCHAVIEHLGAREKQAAFLVEALRVARRGVLVTTPNRWHPIESHTGLPFLHWLPAPVHHRCYQLLGRTAYASEDRLNLLGAQDLAAVVPAGQPYTLDRVRWLGVTSNLLLILRKN
jgi:hypothetical protein